MKYPVCFTLVFLTVGKINAQNQISTTGNVGINTLTPRTHLEILGDAMLSSTNTGSAFFLQGSSMHPDNNYSNVRLIASSANGGGYLKTKLDNYGGAFTWVRNSDQGEVTVMTIDATAGHVGIGNTSPSTLLNLGAAEGQAGTPFSSSTLLKIYQPFNSSIQSASIDIGMCQPHARITGHGSYGFNSNGQLSFSTSRLGVVTEAMRINSDGIVMIGQSGITDASYKLYVEYGIRTRKVKVDQATWADHVFHSNYKLRPLNEVEQFIYENHHLPDVPSAEEVKKDGINLGDNQALLLQKIEELTLYVIQQQKEIDALKKELKQVTK